jgi:hypothetical protein
MSVIHNYAFSQEDHQLFRVGNWVGIRYVNASNRLDRCSAIAQYGNDVVLSLTRWSDGRVGVKVSDLSWALSDGTYPLSIMIDRHYIGTVPAEAEGKFKLNIDFGQNTAVQTALAKGYNLYVRSDSLGLYSFPLINSSSAMLMLGKCSGNEPVSGGYPMERTSTSTNVSRIPPDKLPKFTPTTIEPSHQQLLDRELNPCAFGAVITSCKE